MPYETTTLKGCSSRCDRLDHADGQFISIITQDKKNRTDLRGWFRKFCHRCYNFVNIHDRLLYYTLIERATILLYNDAKRMHEQNKYFEIHALKDTWGKTTGTFS